MQAAQRTPEPDSGGENVFLKHLVNHAVINIALSLTGQPGRYLRAAPGDTALYMCVPTPCHSARLLGSSGQAEPRTWSNHPR